MKNGEFRDWLLQEMPLLGLHANWDQAKFDTKKDDIGSGRYYVTDKTAVESPVVVKKLSDWLQNAPGPDWVILYYAGELGPKDVVNDRSYRAKQLQLYHFSVLTKIPVETLSKTINIQIMGSGGDKATPWMILHQAAHALKVSMPIQDVFERYFYPFANKIDPRHEIPTFRWASNLFTFRSAVKKGLLEDMGELCNEIFVHFLVNKGKIDMKNENEISWDKRSPWLAHEELSQSEINQMKTAFENTCINILRKSVGKIFIDMEWM